jgi:hypothetical protein
MELQGMYDRIRENCQDDLFLAAKIAALVTAYDAAWSNSLQGWSLTDVEKELFAKLVNLDTGRYSRKFILKGYVDKVFRDPHGAVVFLDHKTSSEDVSDPTGTYWKRLEVDTQSTMYKLLFLANGIEVDRIIWDVVRKPGIRPRKITKEERKTLDETGKYFGIDISDSPGETESPWCFFARVLDWAILNSNTVFVRREIVRTEQDMYVLNQNIWEGTRLVQFCESHKCWPMNPGSCVAYNRLCEYSEVCHSGADIQGGYYCDDARASTTPKGWTGLSHSALGCLFACPRKYKFRYLDRRVPARMTDDEALVFGTQWHRALDDLFTMRMGGSCATT